MNVIRRRGPGVAGVVDFGTIKPAKRRISPFLTVTFSGAERVLQIGKLRNV